MANVTDKRPFVIDTDTAEISATPVRIACIVIDPTAAAWAIELHDAASGNLIFAASNNLEAPFSSPPFPPEFSVSGIYATTVTNCRALVYYK